MQLVSCHQGKLLKVDSTDLGAASPGRSFSTGLLAVDRLLPAGVWGRGVIHEILWAGKYARPLFFATWLARAAMGEPARDGLPMATPLLTYAELLNEGGPRELETARL